MKSLLIYLIPLLLVNAKAFDHSHKEFTKILTPIIQIEGQQTYVNYRELKNSPNKLNNYLATLSKISMLEYQSFNQKQKLSFLINSYNAFTLKLIIKNYPVDSIKDLGSFFKSPWKKKFFTLLGEKRHLDDIEHNLIRKNFDEPRIHFAVVCASIGCPPLFPVAFNEKNLEERLEFGAKNFFKDRNKNRVNLEKRKLYLSKIFKWYKSDFTKNKKDLQKNIKNYFSDPLIIEALERDDYSIRYTDYDWNLNEYRD